MKKDKKVLVYIVVTIVVLAIVFYSLNKTDHNVNSEKLFYEYQNIESLYPKTSKNIEVHKYEGFHLAYCEEHEQAAWVIYLLTHKKLSSPVCKRSNNFRPDKNISTGSADLSDYKRNGFDRGHLAPAADMKWSVKAMSESFYLSNMSPQKAAFNRGIWKKLENRVRDIALAEDSILIITGPILQNISGNIGKNKVSVPTKYFKIIFDLSSPQQGMIAILLENKKIKGNLSDYCLSVRDFENETGLDFFSLIPDEIKEHLEIQYPAYLKSYLN